MGFRNSSLNHLNKKDTYIPNCYFTTSSLLLFFFPPFGFLYESAPPTKCFKLWRAFDLGAFAD